MHDDYRHGAQPTTAGPIHNKRCVKRCRIHQYGCHSRMTQTSTLWRATHVQLHKNGNLHILLVLEAAVLPTINALLHMMRVWLVVLRGARDMQSHPQFLIIFIYLVISRWSLEFSICLVVDLQFVLGCISFETVTCLNKILLNVIMNLFNVNPAASAGECNTLWCRGWVCGIQRLLQTSCCTAIILRERNTVGWKTKKKQNKKIN